MQAGRGRPLLGLIGVLLGRVESQDEVLFLLLQGRDGRMEVLHVLLRDTDSFQFIIIYPDPDPERVTDEPWLLSFTRWLCKTRIN